MTSSPAANGQLKYDISSSSSSNGNGVHAKINQRMAVSNGTPAAGDCNGTGSMAKSSEDKEEDRSARQSLIILAAIFFTSLFAMIYVYAMFPELDE